MATVGLTDLDGRIDQPELFFGIVAAVGTPMEGIEPLLSERLFHRQYIPSIIHVSGFLKAFKLSKTYPLTTAREYERIATLMDLGDDVRRTTKCPEILALMVAAHVGAKRLTTGSRALAKNAFIIRQLKHPDEVLWLRSVYGDAFHLIGLYCPTKLRKQYLIRPPLTIADRMTAAEAEKLMDRDQDEKETLGDWGQQLRNTFHLADVFVEVQEGPDSSHDVQRQIDRFLDLLLGTQIITPTPQEYGMYLAQAAAIRSADLSRQVGAALLDDNAEVLALGTNEVPAFRGGQYWGRQGEGDHRDFRKGMDYNEVKKRDAIREILERHDPNWHTYDEPKKRDFIDKMEATRVGNLTEFGRAVHAEMESILSAARRGVAIRGTTLYTTTFPCHNCAKHIVGAGIKKVFYIEPYPKSMAEELHSDSIGFAQDGEVIGKVEFAPFVGIAPRRYSTFFSMVSEHGRRDRRKVKGGLLSTAPFGLRLKACPTSHVDREAVAAIGVRELGASQLGADGQALRNDTTAETAAIWEEVKKTAEGAPAWLTSAIG